MSKPEMMTTVSEIEQKYKLRRDLQEKKEKIMALQAGRNLVAIVSRDRQLVQLTLDATHTDEVYRYLLGHIETQQGAIDAWFRTRNIEP